MNLETLQGAYILLSDMHMKRFPERYLGSYHLYYLDKQRAQSYMNTWRTFKCCIFNVKWRMECSPVEQSLGMLLLQVESHCGSL